MGRDGEAMHPHSKLTEARDCYADVDRISAETIELSHSENMATFKPIKKQCELWPAGDRRASRNFDL